jgi:menaquinone-dependent protoporphyrinogen oxidase
MMKVLVGYASKHGATQGIAERIAEKLTAFGLEAQARALKAGPDPALYDAVVIGGAAYIGTWLKEATAYVRRHQGVLAARPVWLFSSGPLGTARTDARGQGREAVAEPKEFAEFKETIRPRGLRVFFGALDPGRLTFLERFIRIMPAGRSLLPEGDFRNWAEIDGWVDGIAEELKRAPEVRRTA